VTQFPQTQLLICGQCGRRVPTPKGEGAEGVIVTCGGCGGELEAIPF
jgi:hypothetical protein